MVARLQIPCQKHQEKKIIENYEGKQVDQAGSYFTNPLVLQHRNHYSRESFEISPMEAEIDAFLPFW